MATSPKSSDNEKRVCDDLSKGEDPCKANFCSGSHHCDLSQKKGEKNENVNGNFSVDFNICNICGNTRVRGEVNPDCQTAEQLRGELS